MTKDFPVITLRLVLLNVLATLYEPLKMSIKRSYLDDISLGLEILALNCEIWIWFSFSQVNDI